MTKLDELIKNFRKGPDL